MRDEILLNIDNAGALERLYRSDKATFRRSFMSLQAEVKDQSLARFWVERLNFGGEEISWGSGKELGIVILLCAWAGLMMNLPRIFAIDEEFFYTRNIGFVLFPTLAAYFAWKNDIAFKNILPLAGAAVVALVFINKLPGDGKNDTLNLSCIHVALFLWAMLGYVFLGAKRKNLNKRLDYLSYNGDLIVMSTLILISSLIMARISIGLFEIIGLKIEEIFFKNVGIVGLAAIPIIGTYLTQTNPQLVGKVSPVIARIFSPLVLVMLVVYLIAIAVAGKNPYTDREFLLMFNILLVGVMAIIFFSVAGTSRSSRSNIGIWVLFLLSIVTIIVNGIALSAILFRISEWGITPNRAAVLGSNVLILINLLLVAAKLYKVVAKRSELSAVGIAIVYYLPVYAVWTVIVTFLFPFVFGFN